MATKASIAIRREQAIERLQTAAATLSGSPLEMPTQGRGAELLQVEQLEVVADFLDTLVAAQPIELDFEAMTIAQLRDYADEHGIDLGDAKKKDDLVAAIREAMEVDGEGQPEGESSEDEAHTTAEAETGTVGEAASEQPTAEATGEATESEQMPNGDASDGMSADAGEVSNA